MFCCCSIVIYGVALCGTCYTMFCIVPWARLCTRLQGFFWVLTFGSIQSPLSLEIQSTSPGATHLLCGTLTSSCKNVKGVFCFVGPACHDPDGPLDGTKTCYNFGNKFCQVQCPSGSVLYKATAVFWQCNSGVWQPSETIPDCVGKTRAQFSLLTTYISFKVSSGSLVLHQRDIHHSRTSTNGHLSGQGANVRDYSCIHTA